MPAPDRLRLRAVRHRAPRQRLHDLRDGFWRALLAAGAARRPAYAAACCRPPRWRSRASPDEALPMPAALFNLMRNLGGAIWIALIDTVLEQRDRRSISRAGAPAPGRRPAAARLVGLPTRALQQRRRWARSTQATREFAAPLVERAGLGRRFNDAWLWLGAVILLSLLLVPLHPGRRTIVRVRSRPERNANLLRQSRNSTGSGRNDEAQPHRAGVRRQPDRAAILERVRPLGARQRLDLFPPKRSRRTSYSAHLAAAGRSSSAVPAAIEQIVDNPRNYRRTAAGIAYCGRCSAKGCC